ncbi:hypothetical protein ACL02S_15120 [Nocardia sp. 004]|uniref:hypothetical protein n=1 Tax=Nocardia sp. 004 TaxID=3385978 RepID=UPI0039A2F1D1
MKAIMAASAGVFGLACTIGVATPAHAVFYVDATPVGLRCERSGGPYNEMIVMVKNLGPRTMYSARAYIRVLGVMENKQRLGDLILPLGGQQTAGIGGIVEGLPGGTYDVYVNLYSNQDEDPTNNSGTFTVTCPALPDPTPAPTNPGGTASSTG